MMELEGQTATAAHWSRQQYEGLFATSASRSSERIVLIAADETEHDEAGIAGFLVARRAGTEWELENIVVAESARRRGSGTLLLTELITHAQRTGGSAIFLEVRESNRSARAFYRKIGFEETGVRNSYYSLPDENAVLYRLSLS
jgi:[ribosomal protein S18]-alanine N-acetyltransferase